MGLKSARAPRILLVCLSLACGGNPPSPVPRLISISPASGERGGPAFELTVNGTDFVESSSVQWDGVGLSTRFVSPSQLLAEVSAEGIRIARTHQVTVNTPPPGGGRSNPLPFDVPCVLDAAGPAASQTRARLGVYYFDGWSGSLSNFHFKGLPVGPFADREPLSGWQDDSACAVEQQVVWARNAGFDFFVFDWYYNVALGDDTGEDLNSALSFMRTLPDRHGLQYALLYTDSDAIQAGTWSSVVAAMVSVMVDPEYLRVGGKPLLIINDASQMRRAFGSAAAVSAALDQLRAAARVAGLEGVHVAGIPGGGAGDLGSLASDGYDSTTLYNYPTTPITQVPPDFELPFSAIADSARWTWKEAVAADLPFLPVVMDGWDSRPWNGPNLVWYDRTPRDVANLIDEAIVFAELHPRLRLEPSPEPPLVLVEAWNELGEGGFLVPTKGAGTGYVDVIAAAMTAPQTRTRTVLSLAETGALDPSRTASGVLTDAAALPVSGAAISLTATPVEGPGMITSFDLSGIAPPTAQTAVVGFRVNTEGGGPAPSDFSLYATSYIEASDGVERVPDSDFSLGGQSWSIGGQAALVPSDQGGGEMVSVLASSDQWAALTSARFAVTAGAPFEASFRARVAPASTGSGYFAVIFLSSVQEASREEVPLNGGHVPLGSPITDSLGHYSLSLSPIGTTRARLEAAFDGDSQHWPADAIVGP